MFRSGKASRRRCVVSGSRSQAKMGLFSSQLGSLSTNAGPNSDSSATSTRTNSFVILPGLDELSKIRVETAVLGVLRDRAPGHEHGQCEENGNRRDRLNPQLRALELGCEEFTERRESAPREPQDREDHRVPVARAVVRAAAVPVQRVAHHERCEVDEERSVGDP